MSSVCVLVGRAAHPTRKQPCAAQRAPPTSRPAPAPRGRCAADRADLRHGPPDRGRPGDVVARRRAASVAQATHGGRCPLAAHPRVPPAAVGRAPHSRRRASHTGAFLARRRVVCHCLCSNPRTCAPAASTSRPPAPAPSLPARRAPTIDPPPAALHAAPLSSPPSRVCVTVPASNKPPPPAATRLPSGEKATEFTTLR